jgi:hypothetical protein
MTKIFLHVGLHKTGTTSIQVVFSAARAELLRKQSLLYPEEGCPPNAKHGQHELAWSVIRRSTYLPPAWTNRRPSQDVWRRLRQEIDSSDANAVLISSEEFDCLDAQEIADVGRLLAGYKLYPIIYFRRHPELIDSMYRTAVRDGYQQPIEYLAKVSRTRYDYRQMTLDWSTVAAGGRVLAFNYERRDDIVSHLGRTIGVSEALLPPGSRRWNRTEGPSCMPSALRREIEIAHAPDIDYWGGLE